MKICANCGQEFSPNVWNQRFCNSECYKHWFYRGEGKEAKNKKSRERRANRRRTEGQWNKSSPKAKEVLDWYEVLKSQPCSDCQKCFDPVCMEFDHKPGFEKKYNVASMVAHHYSKALIELEIAKCDLICSCCHRIRTRNRRSSTKLSKYIAGLRLWMEEIKSNPCLDCRLSFESCCMDFDHVKGTKFMAISSMISQAKSKELIVEEMGKCELVCSNCHRLRTKMRRAQSILGPYTPRG